MRPARVWTRGWASEDRKTRCTITPRSIPRVVPRRVNPKSIRRTRGRTTTTASRGRRATTRTMGGGFPGSLALCRRRTLRTRGYFLRPLVHPRVSPSPKDLLRGRLRGRPQARPRAPRPGPRLAPRLGRLRGLLPALLRSFRRPGLLPGLPRRTNLLYHRLPDRLPACAPTRRTVTCRRCLPRRRPCRCSRPQDLPRASQPHPDTGSQR